jgi:hypothetical protein
MPAHDLHKRMPPAFGFYPGNDIYNGAVGLGNVLFHLLPCLPATGHAALNVCMGDGSVRPLRADIAPALWWAQVTPAGGETVGSV